MNDFAALGLSQQILNTLNTLQFSQPTAIQTQAIPQVMAGHDIMGLAQTGTGKTAAFGLPLIEHLLTRLGRPEPKTAKSLILAPTRELVNQIALNLRSFAKGTPIRVNCVVGGTSINAQYKALSNGSDIVVATPGRLLDLVRRKAVHLETVEFLVLDEADQMLDLGFIHALREIAQLVGQPRQTLMFSATMPKKMAQLAQTYLTDPVRIQVVTPGKPADRIDQAVHFVETKDKTNLLKTMLSEAKSGKSLVFSRTKHGAEKLSRQLGDAGFASGSIHGNKSQGQRERALKQFRNGDIEVLVATDVAARGIDVSGVSHVYNFDLPEVAENYVHRIGRTARAGESGRTIALCSFAEFPLLRAIEKLMGTTIETVGGDRPADSAGGSTGRKTAGRRPKFKPRSGGRQDGKADQKAVVAGKWRNEKKNGKGRNKKSHHQSAA